MSRRDERNREAYDLGFTGKDGTQRGAYEERLRYHQSEEYERRLDNILYAKSEYPEDWDGVSKADIIAGVDAARELHPMDYGLERFVHNWSIAKEAWPDKDNWQIAVDLLDDDLLDEMHDDGWDFWYH